MQVLEFIDFINREKAAVTAISKEKPEKQSLVGYSEVSSLQVILTWAFPPLATWPSRPFLHLSEDGNCTLSLLLCTLDSCNVVPTELEFKGQTQKV